MSTETLAGYTYGTPAVARSPVSLAELALLEASVGWSSADAEALRKASVILEDQIDAILDTWLSPVRSTPFLAAYYGTLDGRTIDERYFTDVRARFGQWIRDTCNRRHDQAWLDYQHEIGLRHHRAKKNRTDGMATTPHTPLNLLMGALLAGITRRPDAASRPPIRRAARARRTSSKRAEQILRPQAALLRAAEVVEHPARGAS